MPADSDQSSHSTIRWKWVFIRHHATTPQRRSRTSRASNASMNRRSASAVKIVAGPTPRTVTWKSRAPVDGCAGCEASTTTLPILESRLALRADSVSLQAQTRHERPARADSGDRGTAGTVPAGRFSHVPRHRRGQSPLAPRDTLRRDGGDCPRRGSADAPRGAGRPEGQTLPCRPERPPPAAARSPRCARGGGRRCRRRSRGSSSEPPAACQARHGSAT